MSESYSVRAILSATDKGFSSTLKSALGTTETLIDKIKSGFAFGALTSAGQQAFSALASGAKEMVGEVNSSVKTWKTFEGNMKNFGKSSKEINKVKSSLQKYAETTVYSSSDMASTYAQLEAVGVGSMKSLSKGTSGLVKGFGGLAAAAEDPGQAMKSLSQQATQMAAKPKIAWEDFKIMLEQSPAGMSAVAKSMGISTSQLISKIQDGKVSTEDFFAAVEKAGTSEGFQKMATEAKTMDQAMDGLKEGVANKLMPAFEVFSQYGIKAIDAISNALGKNNADSLAAKVQSGLDTAAQSFNVFKDAFSGVGTEVGEAITALKNSFSGMSDGIDVNALDVFKSAAEGAATGIKTFANFMEKHSDTIAKVTPYVAGLAIAFKGFSIVKSIVPGVGAFASAITGLAGKGISAIAGKLFGVATGETAVGSASKASSKRVLAAAKSFMMMGTAVLMISAGFALLAYSAISLANAGTPAIAVMVGMVAAIALLAVGAAALAPALAAGAVGLIAFGAAMLLIATSAVVASAALAIVSAVLPTIVQYGVSGAVSIAALGASMVAFAVGAGAAGAACIVLGAGLVVVAAGMVTVSAGSLAAAVGITALAAGTALLAGTLMFAGAAAIVVGSGLIVASGGAITCMASFTSVMAVTVALMASMAALNAPLLTVVVSSAAAGAGMIVFAVGMTTAAAGTAVMSVALKAVNSNMKTISKNAKSTQSSLEGMNASVKMVSSGLDALGGKAKSAMNALKNAFDNSTNVESVGQKVGKNFNSGMQPGLKSVENHVKTTAKQIVNSLKTAANNAKSAGKTFGTGFSNSIKSGLRAAATAASTACSQVNSKLRSGYSGAYSAGSYVSQGFASGMRSCLGSIRAAAAQMVAAADKAVKAKAQIHSPSKKFAKSGRYIAEGLGVGIAKYMKKATDASTKLAKQTFSAFKKANGNYEKLAESQAKKYSSGMKSQKSTITAAVKDLINVNIKKLTKKNEAASSSYKGVGNKLYDQFKKQFDSQADKAISAVENKLEALGKKAQEKYDKIIEARNSFRDSLSDVELYRKNNNGKIVFTDFKTEQKKVNQLSANLSKLKKLNMPAGMLDEIVGMDTANALEFTNSMLKADSKELKAYAKDYSSFQKTTKAVSQKYYKQDLANVKKNFNSSVTKEMKILNKKLNQIGVNAMKGLVKGMTSQKKNLDKAGKSLANTIMNSFKKKLKIHSPSREFINLAHYIGTGIVSGLNDMAHDVKTATMNLVSIPSVQTPQLAFAYGGELDSEYVYYRNYEYTIKVPLNVDGKEFARATAQYTQEELDRNQTRSERKLGRR